MERLYTIPIEVGLAPTLGVDNIRSTSFYGLSFVRVTFDYGVDYDAPSNKPASTSNRMSIFRITFRRRFRRPVWWEKLEDQVVGPPHIGLTNLRTISGSGFERRLLTVPGVVQVNTWGGMTKEYEVEADLNKLEAYGVTLQQLVTAISNANVNIGGRNIDIGKQSVNIRGIGLIDTGGSEDLIQGRRVEDIESITLSQTNGVPVQIRDVARVSVGTCPGSAKRGEMRTTMSSRPLSS